MGNMGNLHGGCGILQFGSADIAGAEALFLGEFNERFVRFAMNIDADGAVIGFDASGQAVPEAAESVT